MATRGKTNGMTSKVNSSWRRIRLRRWRSSNTADLSFAAADVQHDGHGEGEKEQDDRQGRPVADLREGDADPVDLGAEELRGVGRAALGDQERDVEGLQGADRREDG